MNNSKRLSVHMSRTETLLGWLYFLFYIMALPALLAVLWEGLGWDSSSAVGKARLNFVFFVINFVAVVAIFHRFLWKSLGQIGRRFWGFIQAVILGWVMYQASTAAVSWLISLLRPGLQNLNNDYFASMAAGNFLLTASGTVLLVPVAEECFFRGLIFQGLHRKSRWLAYTVSILAFAFVHVAGFVGRYGLGDMLLGLLQYLPAGAALGWAYEKSDTIFAPILIHTLVNAITMGVFTL